MLVVELETSQTNGVNSAAGELEKLETSQTNGVNSAAANASLIIPVVIPE